MGSRKQELTMSEVVRVTKDKDEIKTEVITYKKPRKISPKIQTPQTFANSGVKNISLIFSDKTQNYTLSFREMDYELSEKKISQSGKAYSLYFEIADDEAIIYLEGI
ncbi:MAG: hypothetical protein RE472_02805 [Thermoplasmatales archaeon]|nr:MAG: hypothetical protein RE472_02805 [Thermoplasmatales archaeon]